MLSDAKGIAFLQQLRSAIDTHAIVAITDVRGVITYVNDKFCEISGYGPDELIGKTHRIVNSGFHPPKFFHDLWGTISSGNVWTGEICNRTKDGHCYWVDTTILPIRDSLNRISQYIAIRTDITDLKNLQEELQTFSARLESCVRERTAELESVNEALQEEIEKRKLASQLLIQSEDRYRRMLESVTDYFYTVHITDGVPATTEHSDSCSAVTGYSVQDFRDDQNLWLRMVHPDDRRMVEQQAQMALSGHSVDPIEHRIIHRNGSVRWIRNNIVLRHDVAGNLIAYEGVVSDITARREAEESVKRLNVELEKRIADKTALLHRATEQFRLVFEKSTLGISWIDFYPSVVHHFNDNFCRIVGLTRAEAADLNNITRVTHPDDWSRQIKLYAEIDAGRIDNFQIEKRFLHADGSMIWANLTVAVVRDTDHGRILQRFAILEDITQRKLAEQKLRESEQRFRGYVENASEILYSLSLDGIFEYVSPTWEDRLGHHVAEIIGRPFTDFIHPDDLPAGLEFLKRVMEQGKSTESFEFRVRHRDGSYRWHATSGSIIRDETGEPLFFMGVDRDITARRRSQDALRAALKSREELERIIERSPSFVILWKVSEGWPVEYVSSNISQYGYTPNELTSGKIPFISLVHPDDRERIEREVEGHMRAGHSEYTMEYRVATQSGNFRWVEDRTLVRRNGGGTATHHEGIVTDITEKHLSREREVETARDVQRHLLPQSAPATDAFEIASLYIPTDSVGGDYYDFFPIGENRWGFVMADVSGKGASAALMMAACRTALRLEAKFDPDPEAVLRGVNEAVQADMPSSMFISMIYGVLDTGTRRFRFCRAGHEPLVIVHAAGADISLETPAGLALGMAENDLFSPTLEVREVQLAPGDLLTLYTDGITEALNDADREFGRQAFLDQLHRYRLSPVEEIARNVETAVKTFTGLHFQSDDRTLVIVRIR